VNERIVRLFCAQLETGFADLRGADATLTVPVSERLLNEIVAETLPRSGAVRELQIRPQSGDRFQIRARVGSSALIPPIRLNLVIDRQPDLPSSAMFVLRLEATGIMVLAGPVLRLMNALPEGVLFKDDRIHIDLRTLLQRHRLDQYLEYVHELRIHTVEGAVVLTVRGRIN
jgi:hypothetical protein